MNKFDIKNSIILSGEEELQIVPGTIGGRIWLDPHERLHLRLYNKFYTRFIERLDMAFGAYYRSRYWNEEFFIV